jgi:hypothetical protein
MAQLVDASNQGFDWFYPGRRSTSIKKWLQGIRQVFFQPEASEASAPYSMPGCAGYRRKGDQHLKS